MTFPWCAIFPTRSACCIWAIWWRRARRRTFSSHAAHPYTRSLLSAIPRPNPRLEKDRPIQSYNYAASGIDYNKGTYHALSATHSLLATDEEAAAWTAVN